MAADLRLDNNDVEIEADQLRIVGHDLELKDDARTDAARNEVRRRALVHGFEDELVVNYGGDYRHTHVVGRTHLDHATVAQGHTRTTIDGRGVNVRGRAEAQVALEHDGKIKVMLRADGKIYFAGDLLQVDDDANHEWGRPRAVSVMQQIGELKDEVRELKQQLDALRDLVQRLRG